MAYNALNNLIDAYINANGVQAITGSILNGVLKQMVSELGDGYHLMGVAVPSTQPDPVDYSMAYFAATPGEYTHFDGIVLSPGEAAVIISAGNGTWEKRTFFIAPTKTSDLDNDSGFITNAVTDLVNYYTKTETDSTLSHYPTRTDLNTELAGYYTKTDIDSTLDDYPTKTELNAELDDYYNKAQIDGQKAVVDAALADRYTKTETDGKLADYYRKVETYDKAEVDSIVANLSRQTYIIAWNGQSAPDVATIPAGVTVTYSGTTYTGTMDASSSTINKIYMVWNGTAYDMYGTSQDGGYSWVPMGTTTVDLSQYATKDEVEDLEEKVGDVRWDESQVGLTWQPGYIAKADGAVVAGDNNKYTVINLGGAKKVRFLGFKTRNDSWTTGYAFYNGDDAPIEIHKWDYGYEENGPGEYIVDVPDGAVTMKTTGWNSAGQYNTPVYTDIYCYLIMGDSVMGDIDSIELRFDGEGAEYYQGLIRNTSDAPSAYMYASMSAFVPVAPGDVITIFTGWTTRPGYDAYMLGYNSQKQYISGQYWDLTSAQYLPQRDVTVSNANIAYVRIAFNNRSESAYIRVNNVTKWRYKKPIIGLTEYNIQATGATKPIYEAGEYIDWFAAYVNYNTGVISTSNINSLTGYIDVSGYDKIRVVMSTINGTSDAGIAFYTSGGTYVSGVKPRSTGTRGFEERTVPVPDGTKYMRASIYNDFVGNWYLYGLKDSRFIEKSTNLQSYSVDCTFSPGYARGDSEGNGPGSFYDSDVNKCTGYVSLNGATKVKFLANKPRIANNAAGYAFYDENKVCIFAATPPYDTSQEVVSTQELIVNVPEGAEYFATEIYNEFVSAFYLELLYESTDVVPSLVEKDFPYQPTAKRFSNCRDFGTQPAANGASGSFCNVTGGGYSDLLAAVYDPLVASFPDYITKHYIGRDTSGTMDMYGYVFAPKYAQQTVFLTSGVHADEVDAVASLARIMQLVANADGTDEDLYYLRMNVRFVVVPVVNVWGFSQSPKVRTNSDGTSVQRWTANPLPAELQNVKDFLDEYKKNASFVMDMHTTTTDNYPDFYGVINQGSPNGRTILRTADWLGRHYTGRARTLSGWDGYVPIGVRAITNSTLNQYWNNIGGVYASTMELTDYIWDGSSTNTHATTNIITMGVTMFLNYLIQQVNDLYKQETEVGEYGKTKG